jgi:hypothetical protein
MGLGFELKPLHLQTRCSTTWTTPPVHFALVILEMGTRELFAQAGLELWFSQSQPPKVEFWHEPPSDQLIFFIIIYKGSHYLINY